MENWEVWHEMTLIEKQDGDCFMIKDSEYLALSVMIMDTRPEENRKENWNDAERKVFELGIYYNLPPDEYAAIILHIFSNKALRLS